VVSCVFLQQEKIHENAFLCKVGKSTCLSSFIFFLVQKKLLSAKKKAGCKNTPDNWKNAKLCIFDMNAEFLDTLI
jgi:hypothetical protein